MYKKSSQQIISHLTLGSLFDGIGGFPLAAQRCGICTVWASEIEPNCIAITKRHFPEMRHLGSLIELDGGKIPPVDIISFGSPCQDLSMAGTRKGLNGERSGLFREAIRIIYEMRAATNGVYPTFIIWENVPGAFSSNGGRDFRTVLEEITKAEIPMPDSGKWSRAGMVRAGGVDIAWRQLDAQYWGIPQRRKRIFLVADFRGQRAAEILFKCESLLGYSEQGAEEGAGITPDSETCAGVSSREFRAEIETLQCSYEMAHANEVIRTNKGGVCPTLQARMGTEGNQIPLVLDLENAENIVLDDTGGKFSHVYTNGICPTLRAQAQGHLPCVIGCYPINDGVIHGNAHSLGIGNNGEPGPTLTAQDRHAVAFFEGQQFGKYKESDIAGTITSKQNRRSDMPILLEYEEYGQSKYRETETAETLRASGGSCGPGSETVIAVPAERTAAGFSWFVSTGAGSIGYEEEKCPCIRASKPPAVMDTYTCRLCGEKERGGEKLKLFIRYILRKLTPLECERLQGFPDEWTRYSDTGEEIKDTPRYTALGNSLAVPCAERIFRGILNITRTDDNQIHTERGCSSPGGGFVSNKDKQHSAADPANKGR